MNSQRFNELINKLKHSSESYKLRYVSPQINFVWGTVTAIGLYTNEEAFTVSVLNKSNEEIIAEIESFLGGIKE
jgi:hypothetical protein